MKYKYRIIVTALIIALSLSLTSCKNKNKTDIGNGKTVNITKEYDDHDHDNEHKEKYENDFEKREKLSKIDGMEGTEDSVHDPDKYVKFDDNKNFESDTKLKDFIKSSNMGKSLNEGIYNIENIKNKDYKYNPDVYKMSGSAANIGMDDYYKLQNHYKAEYLANRFNIQYTMQDLMNYYTQKTGEYKITEPGNIQDLMDSEWLATQMVGFNEEALNSELDYVQKIISDKVYKKIYTSMTKEDEDKAMETYGPGLLKEGLTQKEARAKSKELYATTNSYVSNELLDQATLYSNLKILKEFLPEKYNELIKDNSNVEIGNLYGEYNRYYHQD